MEHWSTGYQLYSGIHFIPQQLTRHWKKFTSAEHPLQQQAALLTAALAGKVRRR